jgi:hypothetical protein
VPPQEALSRHLAVANATPTAHALWIAAPPLREVVRRRLATHWGVDAEEIAITRSASESRTSRFSSKTGAFGASPGQLWDASLSECEARQVIRKGLPA